MAAMTNAALNVQVQAQAAEIAAVRADVADIKTMLQALVTAQTPAAVQATPVQPTVAAAPAAVRVAASPSRVGAPPITARVKRSTAAEIGTKAWNKAVFALLGGKSADWSEVARLRNAGATVAEAVAIHTAR